jgi:anti-repressor protein
MAKEIVPFSSDLALQLLDAGDEFPVDFELAWRWLGYVNKQAAKKKLVRNFEKGFDYSTKWMNVAHDKALSASKTEVICLSIDCFKQLGMMAGTEKGKAVRRYFLECERRLNQQRLNPLAIQPTTQQIQAYLTSLHPSPWQKRFTDEFYKL